VVTSTQPAEGSGEGIENLWQIATYWQCGQQSERRVVIAQSPQLEAVDRSSTLVDRWNGC
jgi:hypothetical protein